MLTEKRWKTWALTPSLVALLIVLPSGARSEETAPTKPSGCPRGYVCITEGDARDLDTAMVECAALRKRAKAPAAPCKVVKAEGSSTTLAATIGAIVGAALALVAAIFLSP